MLISEMIATLSELKERHGDLPCLIKQEFTDSHERMMIAKVSAELTDFDYDFETLEAMEEADIVNSVVITDLPD